MDNIYGKKPLETEKCFYCQYFDKADASTLTTATNIEIIHKCKCTLTLRRSNRFTNR